MVLSVKNLCKQYGNLKAVDDVSFIIERGVYGLLGANGSGKTTLMQLLTGNLKPDSGSISFDGKNAFEKGSREYFSKISYLPQNMGYYEQLTGCDFLSYISLLKKEAAERSEIDEYLNMFNLFEHRNNKIHTYSGGMKQRLGIIQAFLGSPEMIILDEPTVGLDVSERCTFRKLITEKGKSAGIILSTHIVSDIEDTADQILIMSNGKMIENDSAIYLKEKYGIPELENIYLKLTGTDLGKDD